MKIYVLTEGEYSDYHIVGIFDDETKARFVMGKLNEPRDEYSFSRGVSIYETILNPMFSELNDGLKFWRVKMTLNGEFLGAYPEDLDEPSIGHWRDIRSGEIIVAINCFAESPDGAIKVAAEKLAKYRVENGI